jgi:hypothetical protein
MRADTGGLHCFAVTQSKLAMSDLFVMTYVALKQRGVSALTVCDEWSEWLYSMSRREAARAVWPLLPLLESGVPVAKVLQFQLGGDSADRFDVSKWIERML